MKNIFTFLCLTLLISCDYDNSENETIKHDHYEVFESTLGNNVVYGVRLKVVNNEENKVYRGYKVEFSQGDKTWYDTLYTDIAPGDSVHLETIFSEAVVNDETNLDFNVTSFAAE